MANIQVPANPGFPDVYQWELDDDVIGGTEGVATRPIKQLTERTEHLLIKTTEEIENRIGQAGTLAEAIIENSEKIEANTTAISQLSGHGGYLTANDFGTDDPPQNELTDYALAQITNINNPLEIWDGTRVKNLFNNHVWVLNNTQNTDPPIFEWCDNGPDALDVATNAGTYGLVTGEAEQPDGSTDGMINVLTTGKMKLNGFEKLQQRIVGELRTLFREVSDWELAKNRMLKMEYQLIEIALYQELCDKYYCGDEDNNTAYWWYKCDHQGNRTITGQYMRMPDARGLFLRNAGANSVHFPAVNALYDGNDIGVFKTDTVGPHSHALEMFSANSQSGTNRIATGSGYVGGSKITADNVWTIYDGTSCESRPASISVLYVISY